VPLVRHLAHPNPIGQRQELANAETAEIQHPRRAARRIQRILPTYDELGPTLLVRTGVARDRLIAVAVPHVNDGALGSVEGHHSCPPRWCVPPLVQTLILDSHTATDSESL
jgi:hypothetical protein